MTAPVLLGTFDPGSPEWHAARADGIGGSEIAAILGLSPYESHFSLWHRKAGRIPPQFEQAPMTAGKYLEPAIATYFADQHPEYRVTNTGTWRHPERAWQIANPDRLLHRSNDGQTVGLLEVKYALYPGDDWGPDGTDDIPPYYAAQVRWYLDTLGLDVAHLCVFLGGTAEFRTYVIRQDPDDLALMLHAAETFMASLAADTPPSIDGHTETYVALRALHPDITDTTVDVPDHIGAPYCQAKHDVTAAKAAEQLAVNALADHIGDAKTARWNGAVIARRQAKNGGNPYVQAAKNLPIPDPKEATP